MNPMSVAKRLFVLVALLGLLLASAGTAGAYSFPMVTGVYGAPVSGTYTVGDKITVTVNFDTWVYVTGTPTLTLNTGLTWRAANYSRGSGSYSLDFDYTVQPEDMSSDLDYLSTSSLHLNGGTINDVGGTPASLTLPAPGGPGSLGANASIVIDTTGPSVTNVSSIAADGAYKAGATIPITITFAEPVTVTGTPLLGVWVGGTTRNVSYASGSGTSTLTFNYVVQSGDTSSDLSYAGSSALSLNGGTINNARGEWAELTLPSPGTAGSLNVNKNIVIDTTAPTVTITKASGQSDPATNSPVNFTAVFSESVTGFAGSAVAMSGTAGPTTATVTGSGATYNVAVSGMTTAGTVVVSIAAGAASDAAGNSSLASSGSQVSVSFVCNASNGTIYVNASATGGANNGTTWADAYTSLQTALSAAGCGDQIWVAKGTYKPGASGDRTATFALKNGVKVYGGFAGTESSLGERGPSSNVTILSGDLDNNGARSNGDSYHVVSAPATADASAVLDGFTVTRGNANGSAYDAYGGGAYILGSPTLAKLTFSGNTAGDSSLAVHGYGAGMYASGSPTLTNASFSGNWAYGFDTSSGAPYYRVIGHPGFGGGLYLSGSNATLNHITFSGNTASNSGSGGGMYTSGGSPTIADVTFTGNSATTNGAEAARGGGMSIAGGNVTLTNGVFKGNIGADRGTALNVESGSTHMTNVVVSGSGNNWEGAAILVYSGSLTLTNCTISGNQAYPGLPSAMETWTASSAATMTNCIVWGNVPSAGAISGVNITVDHSIVQGGYPGTGNVDADPLFKTAVPMGSMPSTGGNLRLWYGSPAIDAGDNSVVTVTTDLDGNPRKSDGDGDAEVIVDMGAYEFPGVAGDVTPPTGTISINSGASITKLPAVTLTLSAADDVNLPADLSMMISNSSDFSGVGDTWENFATTKAWTLSTGDGLKTVYVKYRDVKGNASSVYSDGITLDTSAPAISLTQPVSGSGTTDTTPTLSGTAGTAVGDQTAVTVKVYNGTEATGTPLRTLNATAGAAGAFSVDASPALPLGVYTAQAAQSDIAGNTGLSAISTFTVTSDVIYVNDNAAGPTHDGSNWANAFTSLQDALAAAVSGNVIWSGNQIWVAGGTYVPTALVDSGDPRSATFQLKNGIAIYGGFNGTESSLTQRNLSIAANASILSGEIGAAGNADNAYHVVSGDGTVTSSAILDGFTITAGHADGSAPYGGGIYNAGGSPTLRNLVVSGNYASRGGGAYNASGNPALTDSVFWNNSAQTGGGFASAGGSPALVNVTFSGNSASSEGAAMYITGGTPTLANSILWGNTPSASQITGSATISYSIVQGSYAGDHIVTGDPLFVEAGTGNLRLQSNSPAIDAGTNAAVPSGVATDLAGQPRFHDDPSTTDSGSGTPPIVDMGAYEFQGTSPVASGIIYVKANATGDNNGSSWTNALTSLQIALAAANPGSGQTVQIWVAGGTYIPTARVPADSTDARTATFSLKNGVKVYGGFAGTESLLTERDLSVTANASTLSGNNSAYHVVTAPTGTDSTAVLDGFTVTGGRTGNVATDLINSGGGMLVRGSPTVANVVFSLNHAPYLGSEGPNGGGMYVAGGSPALNNVTFSVNDGVKGGGMYVADGSPTLTNVAFSRNTLNAGTSSAGAGMYVAGGTVTMTDVTFSGHASTFTAAAGMHVAGGAVTMSGGGFSNNTLNGWGSGYAGGGAGMAIYGGSVTLKNLVFDHNTGNGGDALSLQSGTAALTNVIFSGNEGNHAGGMLVNGGNGTLTNVTFSKNNGFIFGSTTGPGVGAAVAVMAGSVTMTNSILWGNTGGPQVYTALPGVATVTYSDVQMPNPTDAPYAGTGNINADPLLVNAADPDGADNRYGTLDDGLRLQAGSPAINTGSNAAVVGVTTDLAGNPRTVNGTVDMGAYEMPPFTTTGTIYVKQGATGANNGISWADAFTDLQSALAVANPGSGTVEIWVAAGTYKPTSLTSRDSTFILKNGVAIYGGFVGNETERSQRNWTTHVTTLSGDLSGNDGVNFANRGDNSYHVVTVPSSVTSSGILDGFTISGGNAEGANGGGMLINSGSPLVRNVTFTGNRATSGGGIYTAGGAGELTEVSFTGNRAGAGGGMFVYSGSPTLTAVTFTGNSTQSSGSTFGGGGMYLESGSPTLTRVTFENNSVADAEGSGGGMVVAPDLYGQTTSLTLVNVSFVGNTVQGEGGGLALGATGRSGGGSATLANVVFRNNSSNGSACGYWGYGGGLSLYDFTAALTNVTFSGNSACTGGAIATTYGSGPTIANSILWGNTAPVSPQIDGSANVTYSIVQGTDNAANHVYGSSAYDPKFVSATDLRLQSGSPAIDAGNSVAVLAGVTTDLAGNARIVGTAVDMGAYEYQVAVARPDLTITKSHATSLVAFVQGVTGAEYTITVTNSGTAATSGTVTVTDTLPAGLAATAMSGSGWSCPTSFPATLTCTRSDPLAVSSSYPAITLTVSVASNAATPLTNAATVSGGGETNTANDSASDPTTIAAAPSTYYVKTTGTSANTCADWDHPCDLQTAISRSSSGNQIWVAGGTYKPTSRTDRAISFQLKTGVAIYGGFAGTEGSLSGRDLALTANASILSGDLSGNDGADVTTRSDNSYHVVYAASGVSSTAILNGFTISGGAANGTSENGKGGGLYSLGSPTLANLIFSGNRAGVPLDPNSGSGGGIYSNGSLKLTNSVFWGNWAPYGAGMQSAGGSPQLVNVTFSGNTGSASAGIWATGGTTTLTNSIVWGNSPNGAQISGWATVSYSDVELSGGSAAWNLSLVTNGGNNIDSNPLFVDATGGNLRLQSGSPAIDAGNNSAVAGVDKDLAGNDRIVNTTVDMGAYEFTGTATAPDLTIAKNHTGSFTQGQVGATYTITVTNSGTAATSGTVTVTDTLPAGLAATAMSGSGWSCPTSFPATLTCTRSDALAVSSSYPAITLTVSVASNAATPLTNAATVSGGGETNTANDSATDPTTIAVSNPVPAITTVSPASHVVTATDDSISVTGTGFVSGSVVRWYDGTSTDLVTTYVSATQVTAAVPAAKLASVKTAEITVFNPTPGGGTSNVQPFLITAAGASVSSTSTSVSGTAQISGVVTATGTGGTGTLYVAEYGANPAGSPSTFAASGSYVDVYLAHGNSFTSVDIQVCNSSFTSATKLFWWNGSAWAQVSPPEATTFNSTTKCLTFTATASTTPSIIQLTGTIFVVGTPDTTAPTVLSVGAVTPDPRSTAVTSVDVVMSETIDLSTFTSADLTLTRDGSAIWPLTGVTVSLSSGTTYTISNLSSFTSTDGAYTLTVTASGIQDLAGNAGTGTGADNWVKDSVPPAVTSIARAETNPTKASSVGFTVTFSEPVTGVGTSDFVLAGTGTSGASITGLSGSGSSYTVTVSSGADGTLGLNLVDDDTIRDGAGNKLGGTGTGNGDSTGQLYTVDRTAPTSSVTSPAEGLVVSSLSTISGAASDTGGSGVSSVEMSVKRGSDNQYWTGTTWGTETWLNASYSIGNWTYSFALPADGSYTVQSRATDGAGNLEGVSTASNTHTFTVDTVAPAAPTSVYDGNTVGVETGYTNSTTTLSANWTVSASTDVAGYKYAIGTTSGGMDIVSYTDVSGTSVTKSGLSLTNGTKYYVSVKAYDAAGNLSGATTSSGVTVDTTPPAVSSIVRAGANPTRSASVGFTVTFSRAVSGVDASDFSLITTGVSGPSIATPNGVTGSGTTYTVTVNTGSGDGTIGLNLVDNDSIVDAAGNKLGGTGTTGAADGSVTGQVYNVDKSDPHVTIQSATGSGAAVTTLPFSVFTNAGATIVWSASENGTYGLRVGGVCGSSDYATAYNYLTSGTDGVVTSNMAASALTPDGTYTVQVCFEDSVLNQTSVSASVTKDTTAPTTSLGTLSGGTSGSNGWYTASRSIQLGADDHTGGSGVANSYYQFVAHNGTAPSNSSLSGWTTYSSAFTAPVGDNDLYAFSVDNVGNKETPVGLGEFKVDGTAPTTTASGSTSDGTYTFGAWTKLSVTITLTGNDGISGSGVAHTYYKIDDGTQATYDSSDKPVIDTDGDHTLTFWSDDCAGNVESNTGVANTVHVKIDKTAPTANITLGPAILTNSTSATFVFSGSDLGTIPSGLDHLECQLDSGGWATCASTKTYAGPLTAGGHKFEVRAVDVAGNVGPTPPASWSWHINAAPTAANDWLAPTPNVQYSDAIPMVTIRGTDADTAGSLLSASASYTFNGGTTPTAGLPSGLTLSGPTVVTEGPASSVTWTVSGTMKVPAGSYAITIGVSDIVVTTPTATTFTIVVGKEDARVRFAGGNPVAVKVVNPGGDSGTFSLSASASELFPDLPAGSGLPGDIANATLSMQLVPVGPGSTITPTSSDCSMSVSGTDYDAKKTITCRFDGVPVNTYAVQVPVGGDHYQQTPVAEDVLGVYDPSLGYATGAGDFNWPTGDWPTSSAATHFSFTMQYNKSGANVKGSFMLTMFDAQGNVLYKVKSNALSTLSLSKPTDTISYGWAIFTGKANYIGPDVPLGSGNYSFTVYVEDGNPPMLAGDRFWIEVKDKTGSVVTPISMSRLPSIHENSVALDEVTVGDTSAAGNIFVPHVVGTAVTPTPVPTWTLTPSPTTSVTPTPSPTGSVTPTPGSTWTPTPTWTPGPTVSPTATWTPTTAPTATWTATPVPSPDPTATPRPKKK